MSINTQSIEQLLALVRTKYQIDQLNDWSKGSSTYLDELNGEIEEVKEEIELNRTCYLEDELGDVLWDYLNILVCLESEKDINIDQVLNRAVKKYDERICSIESGIRWADTKQKQKIKPF